MDNSNIQTNFHNKLISLSKTPSGFGVSELTGYSPAHVRRAAEMLVKANVIIRFKVTPRRVRYFSTEEIARRYSSSKLSSVALAAQSTPGSRVKARWSPDAPMRITPKTKIVIAPPLPRNVFRTNTYAQF